MRRWIGAALLAAVASSFLPSTSAGVVLDPQPAPDWEVREWIGNKPGSITGMKDKVVLLEFFQLWCPGSNSFSIPLFARWEEKYGERDDVVILSIHSVFEGHEYQTDERLRAFVEMNGIERPVGIDRHASPGDDVPITMKRYGALGTPHVVIVGKDGKIRFSAFGPFAIEPVEAYIDRLLAEGQSSFAGGQGRGGAVAPETPDQRLSGSYTIRLEQTAKTCGSMDPPLDVTANVEVFPDTVRVAFSQGYMDFSQLTLHFDPRTQAFQLRTRRRALVKQGAVTLGVEIEGGFAEDTVPRFEFTASLDRMADDAGQDCRIELRGQGRRNR
jgi:thiol-disulfide isomerase/thioredoxin